MPLDEDLLAPKAQRVLLNLTLFCEYCEDDEGEEMSETAACECLRDAVEELYLSLTTSVLTSQHRGVLATGLREAQAAFHADMPNLFGRTGAANGFAALLDLVGPVNASDPLSDRERRAKALALTQRFIRTLCVYAGRRENRTLH